jgi:hypothetical protein
MKKRILTIAAVLCCAVTMVFVSSCKQEEQIRYVYEPICYFSYVGEDGSMALVATNQYITAINNVVGSQDGVSKPIDEKVIAACDEVFNRQKEDYGSSLHGTVQIYRHDQPIGGVETMKIIKEYIY